MLTNRLNAIYDMIVANSHIDVSTQTDLYASTTIRTLADIGTDHAYLPIKLIVDGVIDRAFATDVADGVSESARHNILEYKVDDKITLIKSDGLCFVQQIGEFCDYYVIAGMGALTIIQILGDFVNDQLLNLADKLGNGGEFTQSTLILQPMSGQPYLRKWLYTNGFEILSERVAIEGAKYYNIIEVRYLQGLGNTSLDFSSNSGKHTQIDEFGYEFGINAIEDDNYRRFIEFSLDLYKNMYAQINLNSKSINTHKDKLIQIEYKINRLKEKIESFK